MVKAVIQIKTQSQRVPSDRAAARSLSASLECVESETTNPKTNFLLLHKLKLYENPAVFYLSSGG